MRLEIFDNPQGWNKHILAQQSPSFLQSKEWGDFQTSQGNTVMRLYGQGNNQQDDRYWQGFEHRLAAGIRYLYFPRIDIPSKEYILALQTFAKAKGYTFLRIEPKENGQRPNNARRSLGMSKQPEDTIVVDITQSEEQLLADMHPKTRYNIRLANKKGVEIRQEKNIDIFWQLNTSTTSRDGFKSHGKSYYAQMLELPIIEQFSAYYHGKALASIIISAYGEHVTYVHGASSNEYRNVMAPYLLQWEAMQWAKAQGYQYYDFGGVAPAVDKTQSKAKHFHNYTWNQQHPFSGITRFKAGFGGEALHFDAPYDMVLNGRYYIYMLAKAMARIKRKIKRL